MHKEFTEENLIDIIIAGTIIFLFLVGMVIFFVVLYTKRKNKILNEKRALQNKFEKEILQTQIEIQEQTLTNISQELHDNIGQSLTLAKLNLNTLKANEIDQSQERLTVTKELISTALNNIRDLAKSMLGEKITEIGLEQAIQNELKILQHSGKYKISFQTSEETYSLNPQQELVAFRIVQEALHNIIKHAQATKIDINITHDPSYINISIADNGKGFDFNNLTAATTGVGLKNMQSRAALINAKLNIQSAIFQGTSLSLCINR
jgi:two-component system, NarL family, sensor kinase